jgi:hypothetical protein
MVRDLTLKRFWILTHLSFIHLTVLLISYIIARSPQNGPGYPYENDDIDDDARDDRNIKCHQTVFSSEETSAEKKSGEIITL